ncbi:hypothetical protein FACS1894139_14850 [Planctomycetales bacterium]|nr:hypothetical protein FACS1894108_00820 [Planctomycetales bacterium]GHT07171.1 hypothetical protein FACS1894139_14850 [Planctomycetales bacterium]
MWLRKIIVLGLCGWCGAFAADFDLAQPTIEMRRLQKCEHCGEPLVVTTITPGAAVRCPKCEHVERRLPNSELLVKVYQVCPSCSARLDVSSLTAGAPLKCGACGFAQRVMPEAVPPPASGVGAMPAGVVVTPTAPLPPANEREIPLPRVPGLNADADAHEGYQYPPVAAAAKESANNFNARSLAQIAGELKISARVNGEPIATAAVEQTVLRNLQLLQLRRGALPTAEELTALRQEITAQLIERELLRQAAASEGYAPSEAEVQARLQLAPNSQTRAGIVAEMTREEIKRRHFSSLPVGKMVGDRDVETYFNEHRAEFMTPWRVKMRVLTIYRARDGRPDRRPAEAIAQEVKERLDFGIGFAAVATRYSEDVFRNDGGEMRDSAGNGTLAFDAMADELTAALQPPTAGRIYGPVELPTCVVFCQLNEVAPPQTPTLAAVKPQIRERLQQLTRDESFNQWLAKLKADAIIEYQ